MTAWEDYTDKYGTYVQSIPPYVEIYGRKYVRTYLRSPRIRTYHDQFYRK